MRIGATLCASPGAKATIAARAALVWGIHKENEMQVPHNSFIVVADGKKMLFFRNEGDAEFPKLEVERKREQENPADREQKTDRPGRTFDASGGAGRSAYQETDFHQLEEDRFAAETADLLRKRAIRNDFESLIIVAPPRTLGELRKHYHKEVEKRLAGEIAKDLTGHPVAEIEKILKAE
ncbi:MAG TPA: host attachment family protein [Reyranella sp.]|nr:host attachment family protein [Reyranella sp.]